MSNKWKSEIYAYIYMLLHRYQEISRVKLQCISEYHTHECNTAYLTSNILSSDVIRYLLPPLPASSGIFASGDMITLCDMVKYQPYFYYINLYGATGRGIINIYSIF